MNRVFGRSSDETPGSFRVNVIAIAILLASIALGVVAGGTKDNTVPLIVALAVGLVLMQSPRVAQQWERAIVLRLGRFVGLRGPGIFWVVPLIDKVSSWIDQRTITTTFAAEQTLTSLAARLRFVSSETGSMHTRKSTDLGIRASVL